VILGDGSLSWLRSVAMFRSELRWQGDELPAARGAIGRVDDLQRLVNQARELMGANTAFGIRTVSILGHSGRTEMTAPT
jgi:hypothetical protein